MKEKIIQVFNLDQQPFFVGMESGKASWTISTKQLPYLTFVGHLTDGDACYYEDLRTQEVTWSIPFTELSPTAANTVKVLQSFDQQDTEDWIKTTYSDDDSIEVMMAIDAYLLAKEEGELEHDNDSYSSDDVDDRSSEADENASEVEEHDSSQVISDNTTALFSSDNNASLQEDVLKDTKDVKVVEVDDDDLDSESGGTIESDDDSMEQAQPIQESIDTVLTVKNILRQSTIKVTTINTIIYWIILTFLSLLWLGG